MSLNGLPVPPSPNINAQFSPKHSPIQGGQMARNVESPAAGSTISSQPSTPLKRGPGRPRGSKNKYTKYATPGDGDSPIVQRPVGRPRKDQELSTPTRDPVTFPKHQSLMQTGPFPALGTNTTQNQGPLKAASENQENIDPQKSNVSPLLPADRNSQQSNSSALGLSHPSATVSDDGIGSVAASVSSGRKERPLISTAPNNVSHSSSSSKNSFSDGSGVLLTPDTANEPTASLITPQAIPPENPNGVGRIETTHSPPSPALRKFPSAAQNRPQASRQPTTASNTSALDWRRSEPSLWAELQKLRVFRDLFDTRGRLRKVYSTKGDSLLSSVQGAYDQHVKELKRKPLADTYTVLNTFWLPLSSPYFNLAAARSSFSSRFSDHKFFYWDPMQLLIGGIPCPSCENHLNREGFHGPIPVLDLGKPFFLIGQTYTCTECRDPKSGVLSRRNYVSWDDGIMKTLPDALVQEFPARTFFWGAISHSLFHFVQSSAKTGIKPNQFLVLLRAVCDSDPVEDEDIYESSSAVSSPREHHAQSADNQQSYHRAWGRHGMPPATGSRESTFTFPIRSKQQSPTEHHQQQSPVEQRNHHPPIDQRHQRPPVDHRQNQLTVEQRQHKPPTERRATTDLNNPAVKSRPNEPSMAQSLPSEKKTLSAMAGEPIILPLQRPSETSERAVTRPPQGPPTEPKSNKASTSALGVYVPQGRVIPTAKPIGLPSPVLKKIPKEQPLLPLRGPLLPPKTHEQLRRPYPYNDTEPPPAKKRRVRHCVKCGSENCKGRGGGANCPHPCRDCGKKECKGRISTKPLRPCENAGEHPDDHSQEASNVHDKAHHEEKILERVRERVDSMDITPDKSNEPPKEISKGATKEKED